MSGQAYEVVTDLHLSPFHCVAASWVAIGQNQSLVLFLSVSLEEIGQNLNHVCSGPYLMMSWAFFWQEMNLTMKIIIDL